MHSEGWVHVMRNMFCVLQAQGMGARALEALFLVSQADIHAKHLATAVSVHTDRHDHGDRDDASVLAHLHVGRINPERAPIAACCDGIPGRATRPRADGRGTRRPARRSPVRAG